MGTAVSMRIKRLPPQAPDIVPRTDVARLIRRRLNASSVALDVLHVGDTGAFAPAPFSPASVQGIPDPSAPDGKRDFRLGFPALDHPRRGNALLIVAGIGFLDVWDRLEEDLDTLLSLWPQVVLAFIRQGFAPLPIEGHEYMLSALLSAVPQRKFTMMVDVYPRPGKPAPTWLKAIPRLGSFLGRQVERWNDFSHGVPSPAQFSALLVSVKLRTK
jgi:hypothetical protein